MRRIYTLITAILLLWGVHIMAHGQDEVVLKLKLVEGKLEMFKAGAIPSAESGKQYIVEIVDDEGQVVDDLEEQREWEFSLGELPMSQENPGELRFSRMIDENVLKLRGNAEFLALSFSDFANKVSLWRQGAVYVRVGSASGNTSKESPEPAWEDDSKRPGQSLNFYDRRRNQVWLVFDGNGLPIGPFPTDIDDNDVITLILRVPVSDITNYKVEISGAFAQEGFSIEGGTSLGSIGEIAGLPQRLNARRRMEEKKYEYHNMGTYGPYQAGSITIDIQKDDESLRTYDAKINQNYFAGYRLGVGKSSIRFGDYRLKTFAGSENDSKRIEDVSDEDGEARYFLAVTFYSWQFWRWRDRFWNGRDPNEQPTFWDRLSPFVGIGLAKEPDRGSEFAAGLSFELARGLDISWGVHIARTDMLDGGFQEFDVYTGTEDKPPVKEDWKIEYDFIGVSLDLRAAVEILKSVLGS